jgi:SAM-dependent methyltransferase
MKELVKEYDSAYKQPHFFNHQASVELPLITALAKKAKLCKGASVLDAGCGQGFYSWLFAKLGFESVGVDLSSEGIHSARQAYGSSGARFEVGDLRSLPYANTFDCVFARGLSIYNSENFETDRQITEKFLGYLKPRGVFIFVYYSILGGGQKGASWIHHSLHSVKEHFRPYPRVDTYFSLGPETRWLGQFAFSGPMTLVSSTISRTFGMGGQAIALVWKS